jgi:hypothetical protein
MSAHVACARVCRQLYVLRASHALVQATVGAGTVVIVYIGVAYTRGGGLQERKMRSARRACRVLVAHETPLVARMRMGYVNQVLHFRGASHTPKTLSPPLGCSARVQRTISGLCSVSMCLGVALCA